MIGQQICKVMYKEETNTHVFHFQGKLYCPKSHEIGQYSPETVQENLDRMKRDFPNQEWITDETAFLVNEDNREYRLFENHKWIIRVN